jgi:hypothetical protein
MTKLFLSPLFTGHTLCQTKDGNTTKEPLGNISLHFITFLFLSGSQFLRSNSNSPPLYSFGSDNVTVTDSFLILPFDGSLTSSLK